jgi:N-acetyl-anhydromuramyl-L-alanine amidase AmpD
MKFVTVYKSSNHYNGRIDNSYRLWKADMIVFHQTGGDTLSPALHWYMNPNAQVSPNWLIDKDGTIYQLVDPDNAAWCNGTSTDPNNKLYYGYSLSDIVRSRRGNANYYTYSIECVHCAYGNITDAQETAIVELIQNVVIPHMKKNGITPAIDRQHLISHSEVTPKSRDPEKFNCPGKQFPFDKIISRVNGGTTPDDNKTIYQAISNAAIRSAPSKDATMYGRVTKYSFYPADRKTDNGWFKHVEQNAYSKLEDGGSLFAKVGEYTIKTTTTKLNARVSPTLQSDIKTVLSKGAKVYVWNEKPTKADGYTWYKCVVNNKIGYVAGEYLK